jgi:hypothetical protein
VLLTGSARDPADGAKFPTISSIPDDIRAPYFATSDLRHLTAAPDDSRSPAEGYND